MLLVQLLGVAFGAGAVAYGLRPVPRRQWRVALVPGMRVDYDDGWHARVSDVQGGRVLVRVAKGDDTIVGDWAWCDRTDVERAMLGQGDALAAASGLDKLRESAKEAT